MKFESWMIGLIPFACYFTFLLIIFVYLFFKVFEKQFYWLFGWIIIRPIRWFFFRQISASFGARWWFEKNDMWPYYGKKYRAPNFHWWILYKTIFNFFCWLDNEAWRPFCDWTGGWRRTYPFIAKVIHKIGKITTGATIYGMQCYHCASDAGCQVELSDDETGKYFKLTDSWTEGTENGTDYRFRGITTCPKCGYQAEYEDGSL